MTANILLMSSAFLALTMAIGQLLIRNKRPVNRWLFYLLVACFVWIAHAVMYRVGLINQYPHLNKLYVPFFAITGPLWYIYIRALHEPELKSGFHNRLIVPVVVIVCLSFPFYMESEAFKLAFRETDINSFSSLMMYLATRYAEVVVIVYAVMTARYMHGIRHSAVGKRSLNTSQVLWVISVIVALTAITRLIGALVDISAVRVVVPTLITAFIVIFMYLFSYRKPVVLGLDRSESSIRNVTEKDVLLLDDFRQKIISEKWHLDPNLKLQKLARKLAISPNKLSELINQAEGQNFNQFINRLRIEHAKSLITADPQISNDDIAFNSGFNSRTLFYGKFKDFTGITPAEFKKKLTHTELVDSKNSAK